MGIVASGICLGQVGGGVKIALTGRDDQDWAPFLFPCSVATTNPGSSCALVQVLADIYSLKPIPSWGAQLCQGGSHSHPACPVLQANASPGARVDAASQPNDMIESSAVSQQVTTSLKQQGVCLDSVLIPLVPEQLEQAV
jgi:hypothetical protein